MKNNKYTFWSVISEQKIEIPTIQRDYAQGRNISKIKKIRENFIKTIIESLEQEKILPLDFVYGKEEGRKSQELIKKNKKSLEDLLVSIKSYANSLDITFDYNKIEDKNESDILNIRKLLPLDGQQRLTTLFLVHWYFAKRIGDTSVLETLKKFTYKTRKSSSSFIDSICNESCTPDFSKKDLKEEMMLQSNFSFTWDKDPTVRGMITTLNYIHAICFDISIEKLKEYLHLLTSTELIYFDYLNLQDFDLSDDLYVKMNARGKSLTEFENFKAWLFSIIEEDQTNLGITDWHLENFKFDLEWNDVFWNAKTSKTYKIDNVFLQYFKLMYISDYLKSMSVSQNKLIEVFTDDYYFNESELDEITKTILDKKNDIVFDFDVYFDNTLFKNKLSSHLKVIDLLSNNGLQILDEITAKGISLYNGLQERFSILYFSEKSLNFSWVSFIERYLILRYIEVKGKYLYDYALEEKFQLEKYSRIMLNLLHNKIIANKHLYYQALEAIDLVLETLNFDDVENWILQNDITFFEEAQIEEERIKILLLQSSKEWENRIFDAEQHRYFKGQINFLLKYSGIYELYRNKVVNVLEEFKKNTDSLLYKFDNYYKKFDLLFDEKGLRNHIDINLFKSAILNFGFYFINVGHNKFHTLQNIHRDYSWKRMLGESVNENEYSKKSVFIKDLVDNISDYKNIPQSLNQIINSNLNYLTHNDFLIHYSEMFKKCENNLIRYHQEINENGYSYLVKSVNINYPKDKEIHLEAVENELKLRSFTVISQFDDIEDNHFITSINNKTIKVSYVYDANKIDEKSYFVVEINTEEKIFLDFHKCIETIENYITYKQ